MGTGPNNPAGFHMEYKCIDCGKKIKLDLATAKKIICPYCGYRIIEKTRPKVVNKVLAD